MKKIEAVIRHYKLEDVKNALTGAEVCEGRATRVYARINEDGTLKAHPIPEEMQSALRELGDLKHLRPNTGPSKLLAADHLRPPPP